MTALLTASSTGSTAEEFVRAHAEVLQTFDHRTQDSGNVSWIVAADGLELFVKSAGPLEPVPPLALPLWDHAERVGLLRNAVELAGSCHHPALAVLRNVVETASGPVLVYDRAPGELVHVPPDRRADPASAYQRFAHLPADRLTKVLGDLIDVHVALAEQGWVACDLYDGCLLVDETDRLTVIDLDTYRRGPFTNTMGRMFGSDRFMAPEEYVLGATIDQRTTVFTLGRIATHFGTRLSEELDQFVGSAHQADVLRKACEPDPAGRYATVAELGAAWSVE